MFIRNTANVDLWQFIESYFEEINIEVESSLWEKMNKPIHDVPTFHDFFVE